MYAPTSRCSAPGVTRSLLLTTILAVAGGLAAAGCSGDTGPEGAEGPQGAPGADGASCTAVDNGDGSMTISCEDGTSVTVMNGEDGEDGQDGQDGDNGAAGGVGATGPEGPPGPAGTSCTVVDNEDGTKTISCDDGTSVTVSDGTDGAEGPEGPQGPAGPEGPPGSDIPAVPEVAQESCSICHGPDRSADLAVMHGLVVPEFQQDALQSLAVELTSVDMSGATPVVDFDVTDQDGAGFAGLTSNRIRFTFAQLIPGEPGDFSTPGSGYSSEWASYITKVETPAPGVGTGDGSPETQANYESGSKGTLTDLGGGAYQYTFDADIVGNAAYDETLTHRIAMQLSGGGLPSANGVIDFRPDGQAITDTRRIVNTATCNSCHGDLGLHGGSRKDDRYCVTCHNPGTTDANSDETVDFGPMIHKIHRGRHLPSVEAGGEYAIWGYGNAKHDYSEVGFPQDVATCTKCHDPDADVTDPDAWKEWPTLASCGSCHDTTSFSGGDNPHVGGPQADNSGCSTCHPASKIVSAHEIPALVASADFEYSIDAIDYDDASGDVTVDFRVTNPNTGADYDITSDPAFTAGGGVSRLGVIIGWDTRDYHNTDSGSGPGLPLSINPLSAGVATANGDGSFRVVGNIPSSAEGSGVVAIEGHPAAENPDSAGTYDVRVPVKSAVEFFAITDATPQARRTVVDVEATCNNCHGQLTMHGANRTDEAQVCVICHNPNATDINRRPADFLDPATPTADGLKEASIDFKLMIHSIHAAGKREGPYAAWGYGNNEHVYSSAEVQFPTLLNKCTTCHVDDSYELPLGSDVLATTVDTAPAAAIKADMTEAELLDPADDLNISPTAAVCSACHDSDGARFHMTLNGAAFGVLQDNVW